MAIKTKTKEIGGYSVEVTQFTGREGFKVKTKLLKLLIPSLGALAGAVPKGSSVLDADISGEVVSRAMSAITDQLDEDDFLSFVLRMLQSTRVSVKDASGNRSMVVIRPEVFDIEFAGHFEIVYEILAFVLEVNYGSFFEMGGIGTKIANIAKVQMPSYKKQTED